MLRGITSKYHPSDFGIGGRVKPKITYPVFEVKAQGLLELKLIQGPLKLIIIHVFIVIWGLVGMSAGMYVKIPS